MVLFERCLIACAFYEEFWLRYILYLEDKANENEDKIRDVFERACTIHHKKKPNLHLHWAMFEEMQGKKVYLVRWFSVIDIYFTTYMYHH